MFVFYSDFVAELSLEMTRPVGLRNSKQKRFILHKCAANLSADQTFVCDVLKAPTPARAVFIWLS